MHSDSLAALTLEARILNGALMRLLKSDLERHLHPLGIGGWLQHAALAALTEGEFTSSQLSKVLHVEPATLVPVIDALERDGLLTRGRDPSDRRRAPLTLTAKGHEVLGRAPIVHPDDVLLNAFQSMGERKSRRYMALLREVMQRASKDDEMVTRVRQTAQRHLDRERSQRPAPTNTY